MTALYVAPHLDDVALSCAGGVLARTRAGERVVVCSVFTRSGDPAIDRARAAEDAEAMRIAGAERVDLSFDDAPVRLGVGATFRSLVLDASVDASLVSEIEHAITAEIERVDAREVWLPLGIGGHIDHRTVFAARGAARGRTRFYEDRPYAFVAALRALRRLEIAGGKLERPLDAGAITGQIAGGDCAALAIDDDDMRAIEDCLSRPYARTAIKLTTHPVRHSRASFDDAIAMIDAYRSQVAWLFGGASARDVWRRHAIGPSGWFEREVQVVE